MQRRILRYVESRLRELSCVVVSDYAKGVVTASLMTELTRLAALRKIPMVVDPKVEHFSYYKGVDGHHPEPSWKPRKPPVCMATTIKPINKAGAIIRQRLGCQSVLVTRGEKGMSVYEGDGALAYSRRKARQVYDVTGAGDTVIGTLGPCAVDRCPMQRRGDLANQAAGIVVGMVGTATVTAQQLSEALGHD